MTWRSGCRLAVIAALLLFAASPLLDAADEKKPANGDVQGFVYDAKNKRDPFTPLDSRVQGTKGGGAPAGQPALFGILWDPNGNSIAMIDDVEVKAGDEIRDYQVLEIRKDSVVLQRGEEQLVLQIKFE